MPIKPYKFQSGKPKAEISKYRKAIDKNIIPKLENDYGVDFSNPREQRTMLTYSGRGKNGLMSIQFSTNSSQANGVFATVYDNGTHGGEDVGNIDVNDPQNSVQAIEDVWASLDVLTLTDEEQEEIRKQKEAEQQEQQKQQAQQDKKAQLQQEIEDEKQKQQKTPEEIQKEKEEQEALEQQEYEESLVEYTATYKQAKKQLLELGQEGAYINILFKIPVENKNGYDFKDAQLKMEYNIGGICIINTIEGIRPPVKNKGMSWKNAEAYVMSLIEKVKTAPNDISLYDAEGKEIPIKEVQTDVNNDYSDNDGDIAIDMS